MSSTHEITDNEIYKDTFLIAQHHWGNPFAAEILLERHHDNMARLVRARYRAYPNYFDDLMQIARIALIDSAKTYDHTIGVQFFSYASNRIRWRMADFMKDEFAYCDHDQLPVHLEPETGSFLTRFALERCVEKLDERSIEILEACLGIAPSAHVKDMSTTTKCRKFKSLIAKLKSVIDDD